MFLASSVAMALADERGLLVVVNDAYCTLVGRGNSWLLGRSSAEFTHPEDLAQHAEMEQLMVAAAGRGERLRVEKRYVRPDGDIRWGWVSVAHVPGPGAGVVWTMAVVHDTTDRRRHEQDLTTAALTDPLTGVWNRRGWWHHVAGLLTEGAAARPVTLVVLDFDRFKAFNDTHGHPAGDDVLRGFCAAAQASLRTGDVLARWGGEEFVLALPHCDRGPAEAILHDLARLMPAGQTFSAGFDTLRAGEDIEVCLARADDLLFHAKRSGRNRTATEPTHPAAALRPPPGPGGVAR
jgi:diguanylate cyclase (GGDEF)-like protein/PAS domain S-box-containing protein